MRIILQKVSQASISVEPDESITGAVEFNALPESQRVMGTGLVLLVGVEDSDGIRDVEWAAKKVAQMRVFEDSFGKMNHSVLDVSGSILSVSQFTLFANIRKGNRPSFIEAGEPTHANALWDKFNQILHNEYGLTVLTGIFGAHMNVQLTNDGPVTIFIDTKTMMPGA